MAKKNARKTTHGGKGTRSRSVSHASAHSHARANARTKSSAGLWIFAIILSVIMLAAVTLGAFEVFGNGRLKPSNWFKKADAVETNGGLELSDDDAGDEPAPIALTYTAIPVSEFEARGIAASADSARQITATVQPANLANNAIVSWEAAFKNPDSEWASGKRVSEYITLEYGDNVTTSKTCTATCLQAFGEPIIITVSVLGSEVKKDVKADYRQRVTDFNVTLGDVPLVWGRSTAASLQLGDETPQGGAPVVSIIGPDDYTLASNYGITYKVSVTPVSKTYSGNPNDIPNVIMSATGYENIGYFDAQLGKIGSSLTTYSAVSFENYENNFKTIGFQWSLKFLCENLGLKMVMDTGMKGANLYTYSNNAEYLRLKYAEISKKQYGYANYEISPNLFQLTVTMSFNELSMEGQTHQIEKMTYIQDSGYTYNVAASGVTTNQDNIKF